MWRDSETELDFLDYEYLIKTLENIVLNDSLLPASIGVYGDWGSGKSSLMHMCKEQLLKSDENIKCLLFNGWLFENYEDAKTAILGSILDEISGNKKLTKKAMELMKGLYKSIDKFKLARSVIGIGTGNVALGVLSLLNIDNDSVCKIKEELDSKELRADIKKFQNEFADLITESKISRLVIFIDELDRCRPDTILDTLEAIKLFLFSGKVIL